MRRVFTLYALAGLGLLGAWVVGRTGAQEATRSMKSPRGGLLASTARHQFDVFFYPTGVRVFARDSAGAAVDASRLTGTATFFHPNSPKPWFSRPLRANAASLVLAINLANAPASGGTVRFEIAGLADPSESIVSFITPLEFVSVATTQPVPATNGASAVPRYAYGPGYQGYGYYEYTRSGTSSGSSGSSYMSSIPGMFGPGGMTVGPGHRDWTTGRPSPLARPWLRPMD